MDYKKMLSDKFGDLILSAKQTNTFGKTLEVVVDFTDLKKVEEISKEISEFLDSQDWFSDEYFLEVLSKGEDIEISIQNISNYIGKDLKIFFAKSFEGNESIIAKLLDTNEEEIKVQWNKKGNIRKISLKKDAIQKIEKYIKF
ncbi:hypothetical protein MCANUFG4_00853 [Mycoplasmopsis canis UFG4]|uniref:Ribosome maturation factor RimP N-terminal domain-containing protein n=1 Tax=Mycoplasmopsis canis UFG4 TaxID=1131455 RepID=I1A6L8_9BACT|nr:ribosome assembly cofactor RimP [Mycoplasmopsis canis]EIE40377.1 hypothetical protein MCANUF31_00848 [Mycoplasmopsis canis UF31]EIE40661.1 hypothetical protein MCANUF33_00873 [Mycoplasmopsis canis UF33]EIE41943.1 hypothetical protein MCANUFG1_00833 [Mycoplasmopsis canis UFG1]EIE42139.1 hypothetical protein MCANUFG4_00853 [Mycoplasmopsis canis UFG4]WQQ12527.1 ribosome assembly cofactor RimP [Mycoplasmopsis canis]